MSTGARSWRRALVSTATVVGLSALALCPPAGASPVATAQTATVVTALSTATYGSVLVVGGTSPPLAGAPLYMFTGDAGGRFGCTTKLVPSAFDLGEGEYHPVTCTGPKATSLSVPTRRLAGAHHDRHAPRRPRRQPEAPRDRVPARDRPPGDLRWPPALPLRPPVGPVQPRGPGLPGNGAPAPTLARPMGARVGPRGPAGDRRRHDRDRDAPRRKDGGRDAEYPTLVPHAITVYSFSRDHAEASTCTGACAATWIPVLTTGKPRVSGAITEKDVGLIRRPDGTSQVTYNGKPLYLYSGEKVFRVSFSDTVSYTTPTGTVGNGNGIPGPSGGKFSVIYPG